MMVGNLHLTEPNAQVLEAGNVQFPNLDHTFLPMTSVPLIINTGFDKAKARAALAAQDADLLVFGVPFLVNPDVPGRLRRDLPLNKPDPTTFYGAGPNGYTDYAFLNS